MVCQNNTFVLFYAAQDSRAWQQSSGTWQIRSNGSGWYLAETELARSNMSTALSHQLSKAKNSNKTRDTTGSGSSSTESSNANGTNKKYLKWTSRILSRKSFSECPPQHAGANRRGSCDVVQNSQIQIKKKNPIGLRIDSNVANSESGSSKQSTPSRSSAGSTTVNHCRCCGTVLTYPAHVNRIKCLTCHTYFSLNGVSLKSEDASSQSSPSTPVSTPSPYVAQSDATIPLASYASLREAIRQDEAHIKALELDVSDVNSMHKLFVRVDALIGNSFANMENLNRCFSLDPHKSANHHSPNLNFIEIKKFYSLLMKLPTKRPVFKLLCHSLYLLKHPPLDMEYTQLNWLLIILEIPLLYESLVGRNSLSTHFNDICYDLTKRVIGLLTSLDKPVMRVLIHWWSRLPTNEFTHKVNFVNLYITFHINRLYTHVLYDKLGKNLPMAETEDDINFKDKLELNMLRSLNEENNDGLLNSLGLYSNNDYNAETKNGMKISINFYSECWHLRTACHLMSCLFQANRKQNKVDDSCFYNNLVDYINVRQDYDIWQFNNSFIEHERNLGMNPESLTGDYLLMEKYKTYLGITVFNGVYKRSQFTLCLYPFLISLGSKISILKHDAKRVMGLKAEQAFISSIIDHKNSDIFFKISVRRNNITNDSLRQIQNHPNDVRKLLKVEFIDEPGIDAGGLKKEWFLLLTKDLFNADKGLITYNNEAKLAYFAVSNDGNYNRELFYLLGVVIGMAIYNSIILDISFPKVLYNKLLGHHTKLEDLGELEPSLAKNLKMLAKMKHVEDLHLNFEVSVTDVYGNITTHELLPNGANIPVNDLNKMDYVNRYSRFLLDEIVEEPFTQFSSGFRQVMGTNALSLFTPSEIQKLATGDDNISESRKFDIEILKSVSKFSNCSNDDKTVIWFWEYFDELCLDKQRSLMRFITGSDRIPATGLATLQFKVTKLIEDHAGFSERLPISHTCFNEICLWEYQSAEVLRKKLQMAVSESAGFTLQ